MERVLRSIKRGGLVAGILSVALLSFSTKRVGLTGVKTNEEYWAQTGLGPEALEELLPDHSCKSSERYFLACANAVVSVAQKYGYDIQTNGTLTAVQVGQNQVISEKEILRPWSKVFGDKKQVLVVSFIGIWRKLLTQVIPDKSLSLAVGLGMNGFLSVFKDPHTYLLPAEFYNNVVAKTNNRSLSVGIVFGRDQQNYFVKKVMENSSAQAAGVKKGDILLGIQGQLAANLSTYQLGDLLKGPEGSQLEIEIQRKGEKKSILISRSEKSIPTVTGQVIEGIKPVGLVTINKFAVGTCDLTKQILIDLKQQNIRGLLLDLRDNPGGQMEEAACLASIFIGPEKEIFTVRLLGSDEVDEVVVGDEAQAYQGPMAVLVNSGSASAAEIVAGALQYYKRAVLVGERTFGKGSFQEGELWSKNDKIAIFQTKGFYFLPSGVTPQLAGLTPDVAVDFTDHFALREEDQFLNPLRAPPLASIGGANSVRDRSDLRQCFSFDSDFLPAEDPELKEAHRVLNCPGFASRGQL